MLLNPLIPIVFGLFGLLCAFIVYLQVRNASEGTGRVKEIGDEIHLGAMVFMAAEYKILSIFCVICIAALYYFLGWETSLAFFLGALCSGSAGYIGMYTATKANVRTAVAASEGGAASAWLGRAGLAQGGMPAVPGGGAVTVKGDVDAQPKTARPVGPPRLGLRAPRLPPLSQPWPSAAFPPRLVSSSTGQGLRWDCNSQPAGSTRTGQGLVVLQHLTTAQRP